MHKERPKTIGDIDISHIYEPLEPEVVGLVKAVNGLNLTTWGSCKGHLNDPKRHNFPWVTIANVAGEHTREHRLVDDVLVGFNKHSEVQWSTEWAGIRPVNRASTEEELKVLQTSAGELADYISDEYIKSS